MSRNRANRGNRQEGSQITIRSQTNPIRCEVCHQSDNFDPETNACSRCDSASEDVLLLDFDSPINLDQNQGINSLTTRVEDNTFNPHQTLVSPTHPQLRIREQAMTETEVRLRRREHTLNLREARLQIREEAVRGQETELRNREQDLFNKESELEDKEESLIEKEGLLKEQKDLLDKQNEEKEASHSVIRQFMKPAIPIVSNRMIFISVLILFGLISFMFTDFSSKSTTLEPTTNKPVIVEQPEVEAQEQAVTQTNTAEETTNNDEGVPTHMEYDFGSLKEDPNLILAVGGITTLNFDQDITGIINGNDNAIEIKKSPTNRKRLYLIGKEVSNGSSLLIEMKSTTLRIFFEVKEGAFEGNFIQEVSLISLANKK